ncbi:MAG: Na+/H+ antiporter NhaC family protein, partial [Pygmaiobacter sp.]
GDRASPMASCARLVCEATGTDYYDNIKQWVRTAIFPFLLSAGAYLLFRGPGEGTVHTEVIDEIAMSFRLPLVVALPALLLLLLAVFKVNVKLNMLLGVLFGAGLCLAVQGVSVAELVRALIGGLQLPAAHPLAVMMNGGGLISMIRAAFIVFFSSAYIGIFDETGMLDGVEAVVGKLAKKIGVFQTTLLASIVSLGFSCNQTLAVMLTNQVCRKNYGDKYQLADDISNSAVVVAGLIPWSISCAIPLSVLGVDARALPFSFYVIFAPLLQLVYRHWHPVTPPSDDSETVPFRSPASKSK